MGYRSDVFLGIIVPEEKVLDLQVFLQMNGWQDQFEQFKSKKLATKHTLFYMHETGVKWYPTYAAIQEMEKFLVYVRDLPNEWGISVCFTRVGEESDDVDSWSSGPDEDVFSDYVYVYTTTTLEVDL